MVTIVPESRWTPARPDCPYPEYWHSTDSDSTEIEVSELVGAFVRALQPETVVETGTAFGQTAWYIGDALRANGHGRLYTYETDANRVVLSADRVRGLPVTVLHKSSLHANLSDETPPIGFAWFDSLTHLRQQEFRTLRVRMAHDAIVGFHDCGPQHPVRPDVERLAQEGLLRPIYLPTPRGVMFAQVL
jgi:hypothetical protein